MNTPETATHPWDITRRYLRSDEAIAAYIDAVLDEENPV